MTKKNKDDKLVKVFWDELAKINWKKINELSLKSFLIAVIGDSETFKEFEESIETTVYDFMGMNKNKRIRLKADQKSNLVYLNIDMIDESKHVLDMSDIVIVGEEFVEVLRYKIKSFYIYDNLNQSDMYDKILDENEDLELALSYNFPAFRSILARKTITAISLQNAAWAGGTGIPNTLPGPHQIITATLEGASDFVVLTSNELRMVFILAGISGRKVNPVKLIPELTIMLGGAKGAQMLATQTVGKVPAAGVAIKTGVAFAFTYAIGEAAYLFMNFGTKIKWTSIKDRIQELEKYSKDIVKSKLKLNNKDDKGDSQKQEDFKD